MGRFSSTPIYRKGSPDVTVLLPVYNGAPGLQRAIESVLRQGYKNFELVIVDDASTDASYSIASAASDDRIRLLRNTRNLGLTETLRIGVGTARGRYVARIDQDDTWGDANKLYLQVQWLDTHPGCSLIGTYFTVFAPGKQPVRVTPPTEDKEIRRVFLLSATFAHPTVVFRKSAYDAVGGYRNRFGKHVEDTDLWLRLGLHGTFHILPIFGLNYYKSEGGISRKYERVQLINSLKVAIGYLPHWKSYPSLPTAILIKSRRCIFLLASTLLKPFRHTSPS